MTTTTPINGLPSPDDSSPNDPPIHFKALADALDTRLVPPFSSTSARNTAIPSPSVGQVAAVNGGMTIRSQNGWTPSVGGAATLVVTLGSTGASGALTPGPHAARSVSIPSHTPGRLHMRCSAVWSAGSGAAAGTFSLQTPSGTDVPGSAIRSKNDSAGGWVGISLEGYYWSDGSARTLFLSVNPESNSQAITVQESAFSVWLV